MTGLATAGETAIMQYVAEDGSHDKMKGEYVFGMIEEEKERRVEDGSDIKTRERMYSVLMKENSREDGAISRYIYYASR